MRPSETKFGEEGIRRAHFLEKCYSDLSGLTHGIM